MSTEHNVSDVTIPLEYGEIGTLILLTFLGGVCVYPSNMVTNFLIPEVLTSVQYSQTVGALLLGLCGIRAVLLAKSKLAGKGSEERINLTFAVVGSLLITAYGLIFTYIGFYIATVLLSFILSYFLEDKEERSAKRSLIFTVGTAAVISVLFKVFKIYLPPTPLL